MYIDLINIFWKN